MKTIKFIIIIIFFLLFGKAEGQVIDSATFKKFQFKGQASAYMHYNPDNELKLWNGVRYIPQIDYKIPYSKNKLIDFEFSSNLYGNLGTSFSDTLSTYRRMKPYRLWARYSTPQMELRIGLQKINFGSASILRPLMWFDQVDPRDPLKLTDGVYALLGRYYFLNNANIWLWGLYGNDNLKGWESFITQKSIPEFGGRFQTPVPKGEAGFTYHHRQASTANLNDSAFLIENIPENRFGFDAKFDMVVGWWVEGSWSDFDQNLGSLTNQEILNAGVDYTFGLGNGLALTYEQLIASADEHPFAFDNTLTFSLLSLSYPVGLFDNFSAIIYYDWTNHKMYNFLNWQRQFNNISMYLMGYINPKDYNIPTQHAAENLYAGSGIQLMLVFNH